MKYTLFALLAVMAFTSCTKNSAKVDEALAVEVDTILPARVDLNGQWIIENIVLDEATSVCPAVEVPGANQYFQFTDSSYNIMTNCNSFAGPLSVNGDSITLGDGIMTEMACDNMATEDALRKILPDIIRIELENDSIIRLCGEGHTRYIRLRRCVAPIK